jgi:hypothetical protein
MMTLTDAPPISFEIALEQGLADYNAQQSRLLIGGHWR